MRLAAVIESTFRITDWRRKAFGTVKSVTKQRRARRMRSWHAGSDLANSNLSNRGKGRPSQAAISGANCGAVCAPALR